MGSKVSKIKPRQFPKQLKGNIIELKMLYYLKIQKKKQKKKTKQKKTRI